MLVSVIIPNFNGEKYIKDCLESVLKQSVNLEVIIVDDHSTDNSWNILSEFESKYEFISIFKNPGKGAQSARNFGYSKSKGDYVQWLDNDDVLGEKKIERQLSFLDHREHTLVFCDWLHFIISTDNVILDSKNEWEKYYSPIDLMVELWIKGKMIQTGCWLIPRKICEQIYWDEMLSKNQDGHYFFQAIMKSKKAVYDNKSMLYYRKPNSNSISGKKNYKSWESVLNTYIYYEKILDVVDNEKIRAALAKNYLSLIVLTYPRYKKLRELAFAKVRKLNLQKLPTMGGRLFQFIHNYLGFMMAVRCTYIYRILYKRL